MCVSFPHLFVQQVQGELQPDGLHVRLLQGGSDVPGKNIFPD